MAKAEANVRKRQKISDSNKSMFLWVAGMSFVIGLCLVLSWFLYQQLAFRTKIVNEKTTTRDILSKNNANLSKLSDNIRVLETDTALNSIKANPDDKALQVILDALPAEGNELALGSSLQNKLAANIQGLMIESLETIGGTSQTASGATTSSSSKSSSSSKLPKFYSTFRLVVSSADPNSLKELLGRFERSIRVFDIQQMTLERSEQRYTLTIEAKAYYEPAKSIDLQTKVVKP